MSPEDVKPEENNAEKIRQLLLLTDLVDKYPLVIARRVSGLMYLIIAGGISFATLTFMLLQDIVEMGDIFLISLGFIIFSVLFSWIVAFRLVVPLTSSYPQESRWDEVGKEMYVILAVFVVSIVGVSFITLSESLSNLFPPAVQFIMGFFFLANYILGRRSGNLEFYPREHLYFATVVLLSIIPMMILPDIGYVLLIITDMGGFYMMGIYMLITAERLLLESKGLG